VHKQLLMYAPSPGNASDDFSRLCSLLDVLDFPVSYSDTNHVYLYVNDALAKRYRLAQTSVLGRTLAEIQGVKAAIALEPIISRALAGEVASYVGWLDGDVTGRQFWEVEYYPNRDQSGRVVGYYTMSRDTTASRLLEREVQTREQQVRRLVESINLPMARWTREGVMTYCNSPYEQWVRKPRAELVGRTLADIFSTTAWTVAKPAFDRAFAGEPNIYERQVKQPDGRMRWHRVHAFPDAAGSSNAETVFTIAFDVEDDIRLRQQLAANEARLRSVVEAIEVPIARFDRELKITYCNESYARYVGEPAEQVVGKLVRAAFGVEVTEEFVRYFARAFEGETLSFDRVARRDDEDRWIRVRLVPDRDAAGNVKAVYATGHDVDFDVRARQKLEEARRRLDVFTENIPFPLIYLDRDGVYQFANPAFLNRHALTAEQVLGHHVAESRGEQVWAQNRPHFERALRGETAVHERLVALPDGSQRWTRTIYAPDRGNDNAIQGVYATSFDLHETMTAQSELSRANEQLAAHLDSSPVAVVGYDAQGRIAQWSRRAEEMLGSKAEAMLGKMLPLSRAHPEDRASVAAVVERINSGQERTIVNAHRYMHEDGHYVWIEWYTSVVRDATGVIKSVLSIGVDINARKLAEQRLQRFGDRVPNPVTYIDADLRYRFVNLAFEDWTGFKASEMIGRTPREIRGEKIAAVFEPYVLRALSGEACTFERLATSVRGETRWMRTLFSPDRDDSGRIVGCYNVSFDVHRAKLAEQTLERAVNIDSLTQALSRNALFREVERRLHLGEATAILFVDLDGFKGVNDTLGHADGDQLLRRAVLAIREHLSPRDAVGRLGGDEFVAVTSVVVRSELQQLGETIVEAINALRLPANPSLSVSASVGVAIASSLEDKSSPMVRSDALVRDADHAMYAAKRSGRGQVRFSE
jgi:diguanylate cyclase (GGDEF)-like protein/PAS domain S-box-containing protein